MVDISHYWTTCCSRLTGVEMTLTGIYTHTTENDRQLGVHWKCTHEHHSYDWKSIDSRVQCTISNHFISVGLRDSHTDYSKYSLRPHFLVVSDNCNGVNCSEYQGTQPFTDTSQMHIESYVQQSTKNVLMDASIQCSNMLMDASIQCNNMLMDASVQCNNMLMDASIQCSNMLQLCQRSTRHNDNSPPKTKSSLYIIVPLISTWADKSWLCITAVIHRELLHPTNCR